MVGNALELSPRRIRKSDGLVSRDPMLSDQKLALTFVRDDANNPNPAADGMLGMTTTWTLYIDGSQSWYMYDNRAQESDAPSYAFAYFNEVMVYDSAEECADALARVACVETFNNAEFATGYVLLDDCSAFVKHEDKTQKTFLAFFDALMHHIDALQDEGNWDQAAEFIQIRDKYIKKAVALESDVRQ